MIRLVCPGAANTNLTSREPVALAFSSRTPGCGVVAASWVRSPSDLPWATFLPNGWAAALIRDELARGQPLDRHYGAIAI